MSQRAAPRQVVVLGAGIVGVSTALWLQRSGHAVTLVDRLPPGEGTSHGNAGVLAACANVPVTTPGLIGKAPGYLLNPDAPLFLRWRTLPSLLPFLKEYLGHANDSDTRRIAASLSKVVGDSVTQHLDLAGNTAADRFIRTDDYVMAYADRAAFDREAYGWQLRRDAGFEPDILEGDAVREREPLLGPEIQCLAVVKSTGYVTNPGGYVKALAEEFQRIGGQWCRAEALPAELVDGRVVALPTSERRLPCDALVVAAGVWSARYLSFLDLRVPMTTERGYHLVLKNPSALPRSAVMLDAVKFVATPMEAGLRLAGVLEFGELSEDRSAAPLAFIRRHIGRYFPSLRWDGEDEWLGHRPAPADSLPFIGEVANSGIYTAFGHHHIGLTGGPRTGRWLAELIDGQRDADSLADFNPERFGKPR